ncbi:MAG: hypothetical protein ACP5VE_09000, partial [Chthonomonadales bacterium]
MRRIPRNEDERNPFVPDGFPKIYRGEEALRHVIQRFRDLQKYHNTPAYAEEIASLAAAAASWMREADLRWQAYLPEELAATFLVPEAGPLLQEEIAKLQATLDGTYKPAQQESRRVKPSRRQETFAHFFQRFPSRVYDSQRRASRIRTERLCDLSDV